MKQTHSIRLAAPWEVRFIELPFEASDPGKPDGDENTTAPLMERGERISLPYSLPAVNPATVSSTKRTVLLMRRFHRPRGLESHQPVCVCLECSVQPSHVYLNMQPVPYTQDDARTCASELERYRATLTGMLNDFNVVALAFAADTTSQIPLLSQAWLEITESGTS
ncbi:MAG: hypothetical protein KDA85_20750 [Planctomycetaceae bacterium]|nr:hypothetical protein [Planctomycetaceae bacterium]